MNNCPPEDTITPVELYQRIQAGQASDLIDVRGPEEFARVHAVGARHIPMEQIDPAAIWARRNGGEGEPVYFICRTGRRSGIVCDRCAEAGYLNVVNVAGGTEAWEQAGLPVVRHGTGAGLNAAPPQG